MSSIRPLAIALGKEGLLRIDPQDDCFEPSCHIYESRLYDLVASYKKVPEASGRLSELLPGKTLLLTDLKQEIEEKEKWQFRSVGQKYCFRNICFIVRVHREDPLDLSFQDLLREPVAITGCRGFRNPDGGICNNITIWIARVK